MTNIMGTVLLILLLTIFSALSLGCSEGRFQTPLDLVDQGKMVDPGDGGIDKPGPVIPVCEAPRTVYQLDVEVTSLEITSKNQGSFGFDVLNGWFNFFKTKFMAIGGRLDMEMKIVDSIDPNQVIEFGEGKSYMSKREFSFEFGIEDYGVKFEHFSKTPLAKLTKTALKKTMVNLRKRFDSKFEGWSSVVRYVDDLENPTKVAISAGAASNIKLGDIMAIYNMNHRWSGEPCQSDYGGGMRTTKEPIVIGEVIDLRNHSALIELNLDSGFSGRVELGAQAVVEKLVDDSRKLRLPLEIKNINGGEWKLSEEEAVNFTPYLEKQIGGQASQYHFIIQK